MSSDGLSRNRQDALTKLFTSSFDARIQHLVRILSTASGIDATFCFLGYGLVFTSSQLQLLAELTPASFFEKISDKPTLLAATYKAKLAEAAASSKLLGGVCSDVRTFMRLWGLLRIYLGMKAVYLNPPKDTILRTLTWSQLTAMAAYFVYENQVYLASKGVIRSITPANIGAKLRLAIWIFAGYIVLDYARLWRVWQLQQPTNSAADEKSVVAKREEENRNWYRSLIVDSSYFPLCFHWGVEGGSLPPKWADIVVGFLGACAGFANFREAARAAS